MLLTHITRNFRSILTKSFQTNHALPALELIRGSISRIGQNNVIPLQLCKSSFHTSTIKYDLMEFFDNEKNWGCNEVKTGRAWNLDELRIKSNEDLHKLWYILLKERNMLMTMEKECNDKMEIFPNPERLDKVKLSMENLESVIRERNRAYHLLETGRDGERQGKVIRSPLGLRRYCKETEHVIPKSMNTKWKEQHYQHRGNAINKFILMYREKLYNLKRKSRVRDRNHVMMLLRRNPNLDHKILQQEYPHVNIGKLIKDDKIRGHFQPILEHNK